MSEVFQLPFPVDKIVLNEFREGGDKLPISIDCSVSCSPTLYDFAVEGMMQSIRYLKEYQERKHGTRYALFSVKALTSGGCVLVHAKYDEI